MAIFAMIGLLFCPIVLLMCAGWFYVRWQNADPGDENVPLEKKRSRNFLIAAIVALVVFGALKLIFPFNV